MNSIHWLSRPLLLIEEYMLIETSGVQYQLMLVSLSELTSENYPQITMVQWNGVQYSLVPVTIVLCLKSEYRTRATTVKCLNHVL